MFISHINFKLLGHVVLERVKFIPPLSAASPMQNEACFLHVLNGKSKLNTPVQKLQLSPSDSLVMKCGHYVNKWMVNENDQPNDVVLVHFNPDVLAYVFDNRLPSEIHNGQGTGKVSGAVVPISDIITHYVDSLIYYLEHPNLINDELIKIKVKELILLLIKTDEGIGLREVLNQLFNPSAFQFKEVVQNNLFDDLSIQELAAIAGMSLSSFKRKFYEIFSTSPKVYINQQRIDRAKELLISSSLQISEIAYQVGFNELGYFSRIFSKQEGISPSQFKKNHLDQKS